MNKHLTLIVAAMMTAITACSSGDSPDRFLGEWQVVEIPGRSHIIIRERGDNLTLSDGKKEFPVSYDKENKKLTFNPGFGAMDIIYLEDKGGILLMGGDEYSKVKK